jgi:hypothetical protein
MGKRNPERAGGRVHLVSGYRGIVIKTNDNSGRAKKYFGLKIARMRIVASTADQPSYSKKLHGKFQ